LDWYLYNKTKPINFIKRVVSRKIKKNKKKLEKVNFVAINIANMELLNHAPTCDLSHGQRLEERKGHSYLRRIHCTRWIHVLFKPQSTCRILTTSLFRSHESWMNLDVGKLRTPQKTNDVGAFLKRQLQSLR